ncbi:AfsR/SARP family transcriptional regulator [Kitasatospora sp. NBC_01266]|uniref:AfsR/SARP family transcriptional regulator n=1 Tax=Kitasatospora sp. NBC_01266 TaxID=2903572 RepID=UPI002E370A78|nr:BTAD domain-containing putative transcriptional regulator [Kitasatospora sp. NBC_01266]
MATPRPVLSSGPATERAGVRFRVLGELSVEVGGRPLPLGPVKQRLVLGVLLCHPNTTVSTERLTEALWGGEPPRSARKNLQAYVCGLRKLLELPGEPSRLVHQGAGYVLRVGPVESDLLRFEELARAGRQAARLGAGEHAARLLREALDLWTGPLLADLSGCEAVGAEAERREARRLAVYEDWAEAELELGRAPVVAEALAEVLAEHPLRERLCAAQMTALHRSGRQSEALGLYNDLRQLLARQLGLQVSPALEALYRSMLGGPPQPATAPRQRTERTERAVTRTDTILPADLPDFTGRQSQVRELLTVLAGSARTAVVTGPVGVGKTTLAVHVAHRLQQEFPDGRITVRMSREDGSARPLGRVLAELCRFAGLLDTVPEDEEEAAALWRSWLARHRVLLLLDDAPHEGSIRQLLPGAGASAVLVTSRCRLVGLGPVHRLELGPYPVGEAVDLLGRIAGTARIAADRPAAERIATAVGLLPLAIRVCGSKLAVLRQLSPAEYATRLDGSPALLDELAAGDLAVRTRLACWWGALPEALRAALRSLGQLPSPLFTLNEAMAVFGQDGEATMRVLEGLIESCVLDCSFSEVSAHAALYEVPLLTQLYAREQAAS